MCGIIAHLRKDGKAAARSVAKRYAKQRTRGSEGFGYVAFTPATGEIANIRRRTKENDILAQLKKETAPAFIFHHRTPTSTPNLKEAAHPIRVKNTRLKSVYYVIHNGIIANADERKKDHETLGYKYTTQIIKRTTYLTASNDYTTDNVMFNDSEALAIDLAEYLDGKTDSVKSIGSVAAIVLETEHGKARALHWIRNNGNPLICEDTKDFLSLRSQGNGKETPCNLLHTLDLQTHALGTRTLVIPAYEMGYNTAGLYGGYSKTADKKWKSGARTDYYDDVPDALSYTIDEMLHAGYSLRDLQEIYRDEIAERQIEISGMGHTTASIYEREEIAEELEELRTKAEQVARRMSPDRALFG